MAPTEFCGRILNEIEEYRRHNQGVSTSIIIWELIYVRMATGRS